MAIRVMLFAATSDEIEALEPKINDSELVLVGASVNLSGIVEETGVKSPDIALISCGDLTRAARACQQLYLLQPKITCILAGNQPADEMAKVAIDSGANGMIHLASFDNTTICDKIKNIYQNEQARAAALLESSGVQRKAEVLTVFGTKGGIGKTTLAVNLAVHLSQKKFIVAVLDYDLQFGDADVFLGLETKETIADLLQEQRIPTIDSVRNYFVTHMSGIQLLCAPISPEYAEGISASQVEQIVNIIRPYYDYIIIDTSANFSDINLMMLEIASQIIYVTGLDISLLKNSKKGLLLLDSLNQRSKVQVILSRDIKSNISSKEVEKILDCSLLCKIPNDYMSAVSALNTGIPLIISAPKNGITKAIIDISNRISSDKTTKIKQAKIKTSKRKFWK